MKVLLIAPPFYRLLGSHFNGLHLGIAYIASLLQKHGHDVKIYNADYQDNSNYLNLKEIFNNFPSYKAVLNDLTHPIWGEIRNAIYEYSPDIVGVTMFTANFKSAKNIAQISKALNPGIKTVVGGPHADLNPDEIMQQDEFEFVVRGEGEFTLLELAEGKKIKDIQGLSHKLDGRIIHNEARPFLDNLDLLPFPSRDSYLNHIDRSFLDVGYLITGRGCPFTCTYCASPVIWQRCTRFRSVPNVLEELEHLRDVFSLIHVHFVDDTFTINKRRTKEICRSIIKRIPDLKWTCEARVDTLDEELVSLMVEAGCNRIKIGVESGSNRVLKMIKKGFNTDVVRRAVSIIKKHKLHLTVYLMAGFPGETTEDLKKTIDLARELNADYYSLSIFTPYYGTQIWKDLEKTGKKINKEHWEYFYHQSQEMVSNDELDPSVVEEFLALNEKKVRKPVL